MAEDDKPRKRSFVLPTIAGLGAIGVGGVIAFNLSDMSDRVERPGTDDGIETPTAKPVRTTDPEGGRTTRPSNPDGDLGQGTTKPTPGGFELGELPARPFDETIVKFAGKPVPDGRADDIRPRRDWHITVVQDAGHEEASRALVDLDRDGKIDERWSFKNNGTVITRSVSPNDDENYVHDFNWTGTGWLRR